MTSPIDRAMGGPRAAVEWRTSPGGGVALLRTRCVVAVAGHFSAASCARWVRSTYEAEEIWNSDFDDEQFSLGRAFYTHLEQDRSKDYFDGAADSDAHVEKHLPGLQAAMRALVAEFVGGDVQPRRGWCGPGVHIFPAEGHAATHGGVVHYDTEGLTEHHIERRGRAITAVVMLQPAALGGGLRVWDVTYDGRDAADADELARPSAIASYGIGDAVFIDSYSLHQIQPFTGDRDRISATIHAAEIDDGRWETWF